MVAEGGQDVMQAIQHVIATQPFKHVCQQLLHFLGDDDLLDFLSGILSESPSQRQLERLVAVARRETAPTAASAARQLQQCLQLLIFGCVSWQKLQSLAAHVACAFHFQALSSSLETSLSLQVLDTTSNVLCYDMLHAFIIALLHSGWCCPITC